MEELVEEIGKIIDPEAWGLPPTIEIKNDYHDRNTAREKAATIIARIAALNLEKKARGEDVPDSCLSVLRRRPGGVWVRRRTARPHDRVPDAELRQSSHQLL